MSALQIRILREMKFIMRKRDPRLALNNWELAVTTSAIYMVIGLLWIFLSDKIVDHRFQELEYIQTIKGVIFILCSSAVVFFLVYGQMKRRNKSLENLNKRNLLLNSILNQHPDLNAILVNKNGIITRTYGRGFTDIIPNTKNAVGKSLISYPEKKVNKEKLQTFIQKIWEEKNQEITLHKGENSFFLKGALISDTLTGAQMAVVTIRDISSSTDFNKKVENLTFQIQKLSTHLNFYKTRFEEVTSLLDQSKEGIIILNASMNGIAIEATYINDSARNILQLSQTMDLQKSQTKGAVNVIQKLLQHNFSTSEVFEESFTIGSGEGLKKIDLISSYQKNSSSISVQLKEAEENYNKIEVEMANSIFPILNSVTDGAVVISSEGKYLFANDAMIDLFQLQTENESKVNFAELMSKSGDIDSKPMIKRALEGETLETGDFTIAADRSIKLRSVFQPLYSQNGEVTGVLRLTRVNKSIKQESSNQNINNALDEVMHLNILPNFSYEIRTALNSIWGSAELLESLSVNNEQKEYIRLIKRGGKDLSDLLESFRLISLIKNHSLTLNMGWFTIAELINNLNKQISDIKTNHSKENLKVSFTVLPEVENHKIRSDQQILLQILLRLIDNAIKYTLQGAVEVGFNTLNNDRQLSVWVKDSGVGISPNKLSSIFTPFAPISQSERGTVSGIGLGLPIAKELANLLSGTIEVESAVNEGAKFTLNIPLTKRKKIAELSNDSNLKILIAQYGYVFNQELKSYLKDSQIKVLNANNGASAIELLAEHKDISIIFTDIRHSDMDGLEFLKSAKRILPDVITIAQAPYLIPEERAEVLNNGYDDYLVKPINNSQFIKTIEKFVPAIHNA